MPEYKNVNKTLEHLLDIKQLSYFLEQAFPEVLFAHIFGSAQNGIVKSGSDVDISFYTISNNYLLKVNILQTLEEKYKHINFDLVNINSANPVLAHEALSGKLMFVRELSKDLYASFYSKVAVMYEDKMYWMKKQLEYRGYEVQWSH